MKIELTDFAKVSHASISLDGMTVIAGKNGTGKSTISRAAMAYFTLLRRMDSHIREQRLESMKELLQKELELAPSGNDYQILRFTFVHADRNLFNMLEHEFWDDPSHLVSLLTKKLSPHRSFLNGTIFPELATAIQAHFPGLQKGALDILNREDAEYMELIFRTKFNQIFMGQIIPLFNIEAEAVLSVEHQGNVQILSFLADRMPRHPQTCPTPFNSVLYLEPVNILDVIGDEYELDDRFDAGDKSWPQVLKADRYSKDVSLEEDRRITNAKKVLERIGNILHGSLVNVNGDIKFKEDGIEKPIELLNLASGVKSIAMLMKAIGNGSLQEGDLLIADEPESSLHPEWQIRFAEFLVLLQKELGIKILLNTHSPYFLKAIEVYTKKYDVCKDTHYYFMRADEGKGGESEEISDNLSVAYDALYKPLAAIMEV